MKKILIVALLILFITITASSIGAVEFGANSANMNQIYLPTQNFSASFTAGYGKESLQYEHT